MNVEIICRQPGFRRCGIAHPAKKTYKNGHWSDKQLREFERDPMFEVNPVDGPTREPDQVQQSHEERIQKIIEAVAALPEGEKATVTKISEDTGLKITGKELGEAIKQMKASKAA